MSAITLFQTFNVTNLYVIYTLYEPLWLEWIRIRCVVCLSSISLSIAHVLWLNLRLWRPYPTLPSLPAYVVDLDTIHALHGDDEFL